MEWIRMLLCHNSTLSLIVNKQTPSSFHPKTLTNNSSMASKFGMAGGIPERRVRPVWDAIDSRQLKNALKLSTALLSKYPNSSYALVMKALKALILERMGKMEESLSVCIGAKDLLYKNDSFLIDDLTLSTLQIVFQRLDHLDMATSCYEYACGKFPNNLELMMGLFNCYVREYSFVKQQQIAIKMYKVSGEERFLLWAVCSIQLQVFCGNEGEKLLQLAEGLLKKHIATHSLHEPEALSVYISLLEQQAKYSDASEVLSGNLGSLIMIEVDKLRIQGRLLARAGDYDGAADIFQKVLKLCPDDWECFHHFLGCLLEDDCSLPRMADSPSVQMSTSIDCQHRHLADDVFDSRISRVSEFVANLMTEPGSDSIRGPGLANLEIERRKIIFGKGNAGKLMEDLILYFSRFGHLASFTADVLVFLQVLSSDLKKQFLEKLLRCIDSSSTPSRHVLGQHMTFFKIRELIGGTFSLPVGDLVDFAVQMTEMYCQNLPLSKDLDVQESMYGEELLSMSCNVLVQLFWRTKHVGYLLEAIMVLELGLKVRSYVWQYKILLLHLSSYWNALPLAYEWYKSLDVKNILVETVSHHIFPQMLTSPLLADTSDVLKGYLRFMDDHFRESADLTFLAYRHRNYSKVIEFVQFKERLQQSSQYLTAKVEDSILQLKRKANSIEEAESALESLNHGSDFIDVSNEVQSKKLTFNEDLKLRPWWTPSIDKNYLLEPYEDISYFPREKLDVAKQTEAKVISIGKRSLLPRMIYLSVQWLPFTDAAELVIAVSNRQKSFEVLSSNLIDWMNFAVFLNAWNLNSDESNSSFRFNWQVLCSLLEQCISERIDSTKPLLSTPGTDLSILVQLVTEPLSWLGLIIQSCVRSSLPSGKKKKKGGPDPSNSQLPNAVKDSMSSLVSMVDKVTKWLKEQIDKPVGEDVDFLLSCVQREENDDKPGKVVKVLENLVSSVDVVEVGERINRAVRSWKPVDVAPKIVTAQRTALTEFLNICESKTKVLKALKL
ncbi:putative tetratricopeptide-like helical domain superfamily [Helianthus annuus]|nr:putative tetratricopeptide-like helical domain superfamily [Helianthus annuus]